jgi:hypothetical protein
MTAAPADAAAATHPGNKRWDLPQVLSNRRWVRRTAPFPHVIARDVFEPKFYADLERHVAEIRRDNPAAFTRNMVSYDATSANIADHLNGPLGVFMSREWHDLIERIGGVRATGDVHASLHHHEPGSATGWPHNDLNPAWFEGDPPAPDEIRAPTPLRVEYQKGPRFEGVVARETMRAVSLLFYLDNPIWKPGDGGETGLFADFDRAFDGPDTAVPPINNSLVLFECTPYSWHAFQSNRVAPRTSVVMWLHRDKYEVVDRWGDHNVVYW